MKPRPPGHEIPREPKRLSRSQALTREEAMEEGRKRRVGVARAPAAQGALTPDCRVQSTAPMLAHAGTFARKCC